MAVKLIGNYSKKLGLPWFSSHSFSASVEVELTELARVETEVQRLYQLLQASVDQQIQTKGFVPDPNYGANYGRRQPQENGNGNGHQQQNQKGTIHDWNCTPGQKSFLLRILNENSISKDETENLSQQLFNLGVKQLNKMQASQLIEDLLVKAGKPTRQNRWRKPQNQTSNGS